MYILLISFKKVKLINKIIQGLILVIYIIIKNDYKNTRNGNEKILISLVYTLILISRTKKFL